MAVVSADECISHDFKPALSGLELFFQLFHGFTKHNGID